MISVEFTKFKRWIVLRVEVTLILKHYFQFVYLLSRCSTSGVLHRDCGDPSKINVEVVDPSVSSVDVSWLRGLFSWRSCSLLLFGGCDILNPFQKLLHRFLRRYRWLTYFECKMFAFCLPAIQQCCVWKHVLNTWVATYPLSSTGHICPVSLGDTQWNALPLVSSRLHG